MKADAILDRRDKTTGRKSLMMGPFLRKLLLTTHIVVSIGWIGAVAAFLVLAILGLNSKDDQMVRATYLTMAPIARFVIVPLALTALLSGIIQGIATPWGIFRHRWIFVKLLLTTFATVVLLRKMPLIGNTAHQAAVMSYPITNLRAAGRELLVHSVGGLAVLLVVTTLSVYKPWGLTRYGRRKLRDQGVESTPASAVDVSRWVYVIAALAVALLIALQHLRHHIGGHFGHHGY